MQSPLTLADPALPRSKLSSWKLQTCLIGCTNVITWYLQSLLSFLSTVDWCFLLCYCVRVNLFYSLCNRLKRHHLESKSSCTRNEQNIPLVSHTHWSQGHRIFQLDWNFVNLDILYSTSCSSGLSCEHLLDSGIRRWKTGNSVARAQTQTLRFCLHAFMGGTFPAFRTLFVWKEYWTSGNPASVHTLTEALCVCLPPLSSSCADQHACAICHDFV